MKGGHAAIKHSVFSCSVSTDVIIILKKFNCDPQTLHLSVYGKCIVVKLEIICST